jgi:hypothetical protein
MRAPNIKIVSLRDLIVELETRAGCRVEGVHGMAGPRGPKTSRKIVRRKPNGPLCIAVLPKIDDADPLDPSVGRSIVRRLGLDPRDYGFAM